MSSTQLLSKSSIQNLPTGSPSDFLAGAFSLSLFVAGVVAVIVIIIAGFIYVTSGGNSSSVAKAKNTILYAVVGLVVISMAFTITQFVIGRF